MPARDSYNREEGQRESERREIQKQINSLKLFPTDLKRQQKVMGRLASGRAARGLPPFEELPTGRLPEVPAVPALALREFLVRAADLTRQDVRRAIEDANLVPEPVDVLGGEVVRLTLPRSVSSPAQKFREVAAAIGAVPITPNYLVHLSGFSKGQGGPEHTVGVPEWRQPDGTGTQVAVIDTGLGKRSDGWLRDLKDPEIDKLYPHPPDPNVPEPDPPPTLGLAGGHGTFVAGIVQQVAPSADIRMYGGLDVDGLGDDLTIGAKIEEAAIEGAKIINLSLGTPADKPLPGVEAGIRRAIDFNPTILIVCAAGNFSNSAKVWPAALSIEEPFKNNVVAVAGLTPQGEKAEWSSYGEFVQFSTVAEGILSTYVRGTEDVVVESPPDTFYENDFAIWSGTSFAAPQIVGKVASICIEENVEPTDAIRILQGSGTYIPGYGYYVPLLEGT
jgi:subtilisin family serine protease